MKLKSDKTPEVYCMHCGSVCNIKTLHEYDFVTGKRMPTYIATCPSYKESILDNFRFNGNPTAKHTHNHWFITE